MHDAAGAEEQESLEEGMGEQVKDGGDDGKQGTARVWGRPVGLAFAPDGSLFVSDDTGNTIWKVRHGGG